MLNRLLWLSTNRTEMDKNQPLRVENLAFCNKFRSIAYMLKFRPQWTYRP